MESDAKVSIERKESRNIEQLYLANIVNLDSQIDDFELGRFKIRKYSPEELIALFKIEDHRPDLGHYIAIRDDYEVREKPEKKKGTVIRIPFEVIFADTRDFHKLLLILNLFKETEDPAVIGRCYFRRYDPQKNRLAQRITYSGINFDYLISFDEDGEEVIRKRYKLQEDDIPKLQKFTKAVMPFISKKKYRKDEKFLQIAITFFEDGVRKELARQVSEMRLIDFMVALEALFLEGGQELKYRFSNRVAILVSETESEKERFRIYANKLYQLRSDLLHGSLTKSEVDSALFRLERGQLKGSQCTVREILRRSTLYFLSLFVNGCKKGEILKMLDDAIFDKAIEEKINFAKNRFKF